MTRSKLTTLVVSFALAAGASSALAGPNDADVAAKVNVFEFNAKAFDKRSTNGEWDQVRYAVDNMADAIKSIQKLDPTRDVSALVKRLDAARAALEAHKLKESGERDNAKKLEGAERKHKDALWLLRGHESPSKSTMKKKELDELVAALRAVEEVDRVCKEIASTAPSCARAAKRVEIAKATFDTQLELGIAEELGDLAKAREWLAKDGTVVVSNQRYHDAAALEQTLNTRYASLAEIVGTPVPSDRFRPIIDAANQYVAEIPKAAKVARLPKGMGAAPAAVVKDVAATYPKAKVVKVLASRTWHVVLDDFKRPERRDAHGAALIQEPGEKHCRMVLLLVTAKYQGNGGYAATRLDNVHPEYQVSACR
jgi:hypothetical protein